MSVPTFKPKLIALDELKHKKNEGDGFITAYDRYIDISDFENVEVYLRSIAQYFYKAGYNDGYREGINRDAE